LAIVSGAAMQEKRADFAAHLEHDPESGNRFSLATNAKRLRGKIMLKQKDEGDHA
jgi:hypothetical protein